MVTNLSIIERFNHRTVDQSRRLTSVHSKFLSMRHAGLNLLANNISASINFAPGNMNNSLPALFDNQWLCEFATGDIVKCLGSEYAIYAGRRSPRIPNGDILLISRIITIDGKRGEFLLPSKIKAEFDVPTESWFLEASANGDLPLSILMEIALQPCGVLSAWLGTQLRNPNEDYLFRNLDGSIELSSTPDLRGKVISTEATLIKTIFSSSTIIQHFDFSLSCEGTVFLHGTTSFGYFPKESMATQIGLDNGNKSKPWGELLENKPALADVRTKELSSFSDIPSGKLKMFDQFGVAISGGNSKIGYGYSIRRNSPLDWFYVNHFFQDPVMPGSLGIESVIQTFKTVIHSITNSRNPVILSPGMSFQWKYRGQVLQEHNQMKVEIHLTEISSRNGYNVFTGSASVWADDIRIYEIQNICLRQLEE